MFVYLSALAMIIGALFGPPKYVVMQGYDFDLAMSGEANAAPFNFAWSVPALHPLSAKGTQLGLYRLDTDTFLSINSQAIAPSSRPFLAQAVLPFHLPGNRVLLYMWWWIFPVVFISYWLLRRFLAYRAQPIKHLSLKQALAQARAIDTVGAYEQLIERCQKRRVWKPHKTMNAANSARIKVLERYEQRIYLLQKINHLAAQRAQQQGQDNAAEIESFSGFYDMLMYLMMHRKAIVRSPLPVAIRVTKGWFIELYSGETAVSSIAEAERLEAEQIDQDWQQYVTDDVQLDELRDNYHADGKSFAKIIGQVLREADNDRLTQAEQSFIQYVQEAVAQRGTVNASQDYALKFLASKFFFCKPMLH